MVFLLTCLNAITYHKSLNPAVHKFTLACRAHKSLNPAEDNVARADGGAKAPIGQANVRASESWYCASQLLWGCGGSAGK